MVCSLSSLFRGVAGLDHNRRRHARVQRAKIFVGAGLSEGEGKAIVGVERFRLKQLSRRGDGVRKCRPRCAKSPLFLPSR